MLAPTHNMSQDNFEGKVAIYTDLYTDDSSYETIGVFASTNTKDIEDFLYANYYIPRGSLKESFKELERISNQSNFTKINFYSVGLPQGIKDISRITRATPIYIGKAYDTETAHHNISNFLWAYAINYVEENFPNSEIEDNVRIPCPLKVGRYLYMILLSSLIVPFDHHNKYKDSCLKELITENYIKPLKNTVTKNDNFVTNELIKRFRHFMDTSGSSNYFAFNDEIDDIIINIFNKTESLDDLIDLYMDKFIALKYELYEDVVILTNKIKELKSR